MPGVVAVVELMLGRSDTVDLQIRIAQALIALTLSGTAIIVGAAVAAAVAPRDD